MNYSCVPFILYACIVHIVEEEVINAIFWAITVQLCLQRPVALCKTTSDCLRLFHIHKTNSYILSRANKFISFSFWPNASAHHISLSTFRLYICNNTKYKSASGARSSSSYLQLIYDSFGGDMSAKSGWGGGASGCYSVCAHALQPETRYVTYVQCVAVLYSLSARV